MNLKLLKKFLKSQLEEDIKRLRPKFMNGKGTLKRNIQIMDQDTVRIDVTIQMEVKQWTESIVKWLTHLSEKMITNETVEKEAIDESRKEHHGRKREDRCSGLTPKP